VSSGDFSSSDDFEQGRVSDDLEELSDWIDENNKENKQKMFINHREQKVVNR
jgi:hypothetical protein